MKKQRDTTLVYICILFTVFLCGVFIGRATSKYPINLVSTVNNTMHHNDSVGDFLFIDDKMNINVATAKDLILIPSIGEATAQSIVDYRNEHGAFQSISELKNVSGLGAERILELLDYIIVGGTYEDTGR